jgi:hypothetical protein
MQADAGRTVPTSQMMMVTPMVAPFIFHHQDGSVGPRFAGYDSRTAGYGTLPFSWPAEGAWPYFCEPSFGEQAPQQLPMEAGASTAEMVEQPSEHCHKSMFPDIGYLQEDVPSQLQMEAEVMQARDPDVQMRPTTSVTSLRRRRRPECPSQNPRSKANFSGEFEVDETCSDEEQEAEVRQAQEIANGLLVQMQTGGASLNSALAKFERLAFSSKVTSRAAQMALEQADMTDAVLLAGGLRGHVRCAVQSKHANYVVQKITELLPAARAGFIVDELKGFGHEAARHTFGCRVLCRIMEHLSPSDANTVELLDEVLRGVDNLCSHPFGSFVVRHVLEFGLAAHKQRVVQVLLADVVAFAKHKFGSHVVEAALRHASPEDQRLLSAALSSNKDELMAVATNQFGRHVVRAVLATHGAAKDEAVEKLTALEGQLKSSRYGKSVYQALRAALA